MTGNDFNGHTFLISLLMLGCLLPAPAHSQGQVTPRISADRDTENRLNQMKAEDDRIRKEMAYSNGGYLPKLTKNDIKRMKEMRKVDLADLEKYKEFLKTDNTGIVRLFPNLDCVTATVIRIDGECEGFVPGSSFLSFRSRQYADPLNQDFGYWRGQFVSGGFFSQGIFVSIGDVPIEDVKLDHKALKYLAELQPDTDAAAARARSGLFRRGVNTGEYTYASYVKAKENTTYALRLIAYRFGNSLPPPTPESSPIEVLLSSLAFDKRVDSITLFRIVDMDHRGKITILWKELSRKEAPKIKFAKGESYGDLR
jgi:hypothetical protein